VCHMTLLLVATATAAGTQRAHMGGICLAIRQEPAPTREVLAVIGRFGRTSRSQGVAKCSIAAVLSRRFHRNRISKWRSVLETRYSAEASDALLVAYCALHVADRTAQFAVQGEGVESSPQRGIDRGVRIAAKGQS
jgi:hypothetical protein